MKTKLLRRRSLRNNTSNYLNSRRRQIFNQQKNLGVLEQTIKSLNQPLNEVLLKNDSQLVPHYNSLINVKNEIYGVF